jgi:hypothetical protein
LVFSPDGRMLAWTAAYGSLPRYDGTVRLFEVATGRERQRVTGHRGPVTSLAFSRDGRRLLTASEDSTILVWDLMSPRGERPGRLSSEDLQALWSDLAGGDAPRADRAIRTLAAVPEQAVPLLREQLRSETPVDPQRLTRLVTDLGSDRFVVREEAAKELARLIDHAAPALRHALADRPTLEFRQRAEKLLQAIDGLITDAELLRKLRAVEALEHIATPAARAHLKALAGGAPGAALTDAAAAALTRLGKNR